MTPFIRRSSLILSLLLAHSALAADLPHHDLEVLVDPIEHRMEVVDRIRPGTGLVPDADGGYRFALHAGLEPRVVTRHWSLERVHGEVDVALFGINVSSESVADDVPLEGWRLVPRKRAGDQVELRYGGVIDHPLAMQGEEYQRAFSETPGTIDEQGVFLAESTFWTPTFGDGRMTFELRVQVVGEGWEVVSQGRRTTSEDGSVAWSAGSPQEEVYLIAGPLIRTCEQAGEVEMCALLRSDDPALAQRYLTATRRYLTMYEAILPDYPYASFALVENFWETGYGMPGFTLLGPKVIRFPWILTSSYPHELLHNWWGNSVYVAAEGGNWCEGLTAYMADHLLAEQRGEGALHRRTILKRYTDFVGPDDDFPLTGFRTRTSAATEAVGYGKSAMLMHMARRGLGDEAFVAAMADFHRRHAFDRATFADLGSALDDGGEGEWTAFVEEWIARTGAPELRVVQAAVAEADDGGWTLSLDVRQVQAEEPFPITVPVAVAVEGLDEAQATDRVEMVLSAA